MKETPDVIKLVDASAVITLLGVRHDGSNSIFNLLVIEKARFI